MNINEIMNPAPKASKTNVVSAFRVVLVAAEMIRSLGTVPSGELYARFMGYMDLIAYNKMLGILKSSQLVSESSAHLLTWIGPKVDA